MKAGKAFSKANHPKRNKDENRENLHQSEPPDKVNAFMFISDEQKVKEQMVTQVTMIKVIEDDGPGHKNL